MLILLISLIVGGLAWWASGDMDFWDGFAWLILVIIFTAYTFFDNDEST